MANTTGTIGTLFQGARFKHFDWKSLTLLPDEPLPDGATVTPADAIARLNIPFSDVDAACRHPLDDDIAWLFSGSKVLDYKISERRVMTCATASSEVAQVEIKLHPVFRVLPSEFHNGITAAVIDTPEAEGRGEFKAIVYVYKGSSLVVLRLSSTCTAQRLALGAGPTPTVTFGAETRDEPWWNKLLAPFKPRADLGALTCVANVMGSSEAYQFSAEKFATGASPDQAPKSREGWNKVHPKAALPANVGVGDARARATSLGKKSTFVTAGALEPPDTLVAIKGNRDPSSLRPPTDEFIRDLKRLYPFERQMGLWIRSQRMKALVRRVTDENDLPDHLRIFVPVRALHADCPGYELTFYVMPDFVSIGGEDDMLRLALTASAGQDVATRFGCLLPTARMGALIYLAEGAQLIEYSSYPKSEEGRFISTAFIQRHHDDIRREHARLGHTLGRLTAGHKKEVIMPDRSGAAIESQGTWYWGGLKKFDGELSDTGDTRALTVAHPEVKNADKSVSYPHRRVANDAERTALEVGALCHTDETNTGHDEYSQGVRLVSTVGYIKKAAGPWSRVDIAKDVLADGSLYKLLSTKQIKEAGPRYADAWAAWKVVDITVNARGVRVSNQLSTAAEIKAAAIAQLSLGRDYEAATLFRGGTAIADSERLAPDAGQAFSLWLPNC